MNCKEIEEKFLKIHNKRIKILNIIKKQQRNKDKYIFIFDNIKYETRISSLFNYPTLRSCIEPTKLIEKEFYNKFKEKIQIHEYKDMNSDCLFSYNKIKFSKKGNSILDQLPTIKSCLEKNKYIIKLAENKHGKDRYTYPNLNYKSVHVKIKIKCNICNNEFKQTIAHHVYTGEGCPVCNKYTSLSDVSYQHNKYLYIVKLFNNDEKFIKIGITVNNSKSRLFSIPYKNEVIYFKRLLNTKYVESLLLKKHKKLRYKPRIKFGGYTECFHTSILNEIDYDYLNERCF